MSSGGLRRWTTKVWDTAGTVWEPALVGLSIVGTLYLVATGFGLTELLGIEHKPSQAFAVALIAAVAQSVLIFTHRLSQNLNYYSTKLDDIVAPPVFRTAAEVVDDVWTSAAADHRRRFHKLEVLALNGIHSGGLIRGKLSARTDIRWDIDLYCLDPALRDSSSSFRPKWQFDTLATVEAIRGFRSKSTITLRTYRSHSPVHGYRLNGEDIYISYAVWPGEGQRSVVDYTFWEKIKGDDKTARAVEYRRLFDSWLGHVKGEGGRDSVSNNPKSGG